MRSTAKRSSESFGRRKTGRAVERSQLTKLRMRDFDRPWFPTRIALQSDVELAQGKRSDAESEPLCDVECQQFIGALRSNHRDQKRIHLWFRDHRDRCIAQQSPRPTEFYPTLGSSAARERSNMRTLAPVDLTSIATHDAIKMGGPNAGKEI